MVLRPSDLGGGVRVTAERYYKAADFPSVISYERELESGRSGSMELPYVASQAGVGTSAGSTASYLGTIRRLLVSKQGRALLEKSLTGQLPAGGLVSKPQVGRPRALGVGAGSFELPMFFQVLGLRTELHFAFFRVERVLGAVLVVGAPGERGMRAVIVRLAKIASGRMRAELAPRSTVPPEVAGTPAVGQTLTATTGTWRGSPSSFAYQWQRCDSAGASCVAVTGATGQSYLLADADTGSRMRVSVSARNAIGSATAASAPTGVVSSPGAPTNTSPPAISGVAQVGQTLTATTGVWTGSPISFGFQWQRCNASGAACVDVSGATAGTYVLGTADVGSTIRVAVTATNAVGAATAVSPPTSVVVWGRRPAPADRRRFLL
jgi:hypothetical protein